MRPTFLTEVAKSKYLSSLPSFKERKAQEISTIVLTLITLSLFGIFAINPTLSTIAQLKRELIDNQEVNKKLEIKIKNLGQLQIQYASLQSQIPIVFAAVPQTPQATLLTGQLKKLAADNNIVLNRSQVFQVDIPLEEKKTKKTSTSFAFSAATEGYYVDTIAFMKSLSTYERIVTIDSIALSSGPDGSNRVELNIRGKAYFKQ